jgi:hypothetical protein
MKSPDESTREMGYGILGLRLTDDPDSIGDADAEKDVGHDRERDLHRSPNWARAAMNGALISIGVFRSSGGHGGDLAHPRRWRVRGLRIRARRNNRTHNDRLEGRRGSPPPEAWTRGAQYLREHVLASAGLLPMPERTPLVR